MIRLSISRHVSDPGPNRPSSCLAGSSGLVYVYTSRMVIAGVPVAGPQFRWALLGSIVPSEDLAGRVQQPGPDRRRVEDHDLVAEASQPVHGRPLMLERQRDHPPAVVAGWCRRLESGSGGRAEDLGNPAERLRRGGRAVTWIRGRLASNSADHRSQNPASSKPAGRPKASGRTRALSDAPGPEHAGWPRGAGHRHQVPGPCLVHQAQAARRRAGRRSRCCRHGPRRTGSRRQPAAQAQRLGQRTQVGHRPRLAAEPAGHVEVDERRARARARQVTSDLPVPPRRARLRPARARGSGAPGTPEDEQGLSLLGPQARGAGTGSPRSAGIRRRVPTRRRPELPQR